MNTRTFIGSLITIPFAAEAAITKRFKPYYLKAMYKHTHIYLEILNKDGHDIVKNYNIKKASEISFDVFKNNTKGWVSYFPVEDGVEFKGMKVYVESFWI